MGDETRGINRDEWVARGCEAVEKYSEVHRGLGVVTKLHIDHEVWVITGIYTMRFLIITSVFLRDAEVSILNSSSYYHTYYFLAIGI